MAGRTPRDRPAPAVTERRDLACAFQPGLGCFEIDEGFLPGNFAAQIPAGHRVFLGIGQFDPGTDTVEQCGGHHVIAMLRIALADAPDVAGDAENFLQQDDAAARRFVRPRLVGAEAVAVARLQRDGLRTHEATRQSSTIGNCTDFRKYIDT